MIILSKVVVAVSENLNNNFNNSMLHQTKHVRVWWYATRHVCGSIFKYGLSLMLCHKIRFNVTLKITFWSGSAHHVYVIWRYDRFSKSSTNIVRVSGSRPGGAARPTEKTSSALTKRCELSS